jgi:hypothetical protein
VRCRFGRRKSLGADVKGMGGDCDCVGVARLRNDKVEGGRVSIGDVARCEDWGAGRAVAVTGVGKMEDRAGRDFIRIEVGIVKRNAAGFDEGVDGLAGGTMKSSPCIRLVELVCDFAREAAVGAS